MKIIEHKLFDLCDKIQHLKLNPLTSQKPIPELLKETGYDVIGDDSDGNFCIRVNEGSYLEGIAKSKVNYTLKIKIVDVEEEIRGIYRWDDFTPIIDLLINAATELYPVYLEEKRKERQIAIFQKLIDGILPTKKVQNRTFAFNPKFRNGELSMVMYTEILSPLCLSIEMRQDDFIPKMERLMKVCESIPEIIAESRPGSIKRADKFEGAEEEWKKFMALPDGIKYLNSDGKNKNYDRKNYRNFVENPFSKKSEYSPRAKKLVSFLNKKGIEYGYCDNGDFIIQFGPRGGYDDYGVLCWNDINETLNDFNCHISKKGELKRRSKKFFPGMAERFTESEVIQLLQLSLTNNAFNVHPENTNILRHNLPRAVAKNRLPAGLKIQGPRLGRLEWTGKGFGPQLCIMVPEIGVRIQLVWETFRQFVSENNQIEQALLFIEALRNLAAQDKEVKFIDNPTDK